MASLCAPPFPLVPQIFYSLFASLSFFSSGMCAGWASQTLVNTVTRTWSWGVWPQEVPWILATLELGALMASIPVGYAVDKYGRKYVNVTVGFLFLLSWLIVLGADMRPENLYSARVVAGLAMGATSIVVPIYVAEITEARARGVLLTLSKAMTLAGLLAMHALGPRVSYRSLVALSSLPVVLFLCTFSWSPESPHLLAVKERWNKATESLNSLRATPRAVKLELGDLMRKDEERAKVPLRHLPRRPVARNALLLSLALGLLAALSGHSAVTFYGALQLPPSTDPYFVGPETLCMCVAATTLAGCLVAAALVDTLGRRPLLVTSAASCTVAMAAVGYLFLEVSRCEDAANTCDLGWWLVSGLLVWAFSYGLGLFSVPCTLAVEMAPTNARGVIVATSAAFSTLGCVLATMTFEMADKHVACWVYAGCSGLCLLLAALAAPETKGKALAAIQRDLTERYGRANLDLPEAPPAASATPGDVPLVRHNGVGRGVPLAAPRPAQPHSSRSEPPPHH